MSIFAMPCFSTSPKTTSEDPAQLVVKAPEYWRTPKRCREVGTSAVAGVLECGGIPPLCAPSLPRPRHHSRAAGSAARTTPHARLGGIQSRPAPYMYHLQCVFHVGVLGASSATPTLPRPADCLFAIACRPSSSMKDRPPNPNPRRASASPPPRRRARLPRIAL